MIPYSLGEEREDLRFGRLVQYSQHPKWTEMGLSRISRMVISEILKKKGEICVKGIEISISSVRNSRDFRRFTFLRQASVVLDEILYF